ncbi:hypothetical protein LEMLEM_LOCUS10290 [Lemmus lemmus]
MDGLLSSQVTKEYQGERNRILEGSHGMNVAPITAEVIL